MEKTACPGAFKCEPVYFCTPIQANLLLGEGRGRTLVLLARHGITDWNMEVRLQGRQDIPLNGAGIEQAKTAAGFIAAAFKDRSSCVEVYTSPLSRAKETATFISGEINGSLPTVLEGLIERDYGSLEGLTSAERQKKYGLDHIPDDMETPAEATTRIMRAIGEVRRISGEDAAVVVTHGGLLNCLFARITRGRAGAGGNIAANCNVSLVAAGDRDVIPLAYNLGGKELNEYIKNMWENRA